MTNMRISEVWIYPIKSLGGIRVKSARILGKGLQHDRRWMLIDEQNRFMTQRVNPFMALFKLALDNEHLVVSLRGDSIRIPLQPEAGEKTVATIWDDSVTVTLCREHYGHWFSRHLGIECRLVSFPEAEPRQIDPKYGQPGDHVSLADAYPLLVIGQGSLDDLNSRLAEPVPMNRFRPNLVVTGANPYAEDEWKQFRAGVNRMLGVKPCARCVLTTVQQETGERGTEPLATLSTYRKKENKVLFGQNVIPIDFGVLAEGDEILVDD